MNQYYFLVKCTKYMQDLQTVSDYIDFLKCRLSVNLRKLYAIL